MLLAGLTTAGAATVVQNQSVTNLGNSEQSYSWNAFDTNLGTLTSAVFVVNGTYSGSFRVYAPSSGADTFVFYVDSTTTLNLQGQGELSESYVEVLFDGSSVPEGSYEDFTIEDIEMTIDSENLVGTVGSNYFTNSSFTSSLNRYANADTSESRSGSDFTNMKLNGTISLTYTYTPSAVEPVPEISTVTMGGAGGLLLLGIAARSRRRQQPSDSVPA
jgi:hypothetical protein